jgi:tetratricopeptide (TPR) repeat protein
MTSSREVSAQLQFPIRLLVEGDGNRGAIEVGRAGLVLGRGVGVSPWLDGDPAVSRHHARIGSRADGAVEIEDLGSDNGTFINNARITGPAALRAGDHVRLGSVSMVVEAGSPYDPDQTTVMAWPASPGATASDTSPEQLLQNGKRLLSEGKTQDAARVFNHFLETGQRLAEAQYFLGVIDLGKRDLQSARSRFETALGRNPGYADAHYQLGLIAELEGRPHDARRLYEQVLQLNPTHASAQVRMSRLKVPHVAPQAPIQPVAAPAPDPPTQAETAPTQMNIDLSQSFGVYEYLRRDESPLSKQTIALIDDLKLTVRPRYIAYVGRFFGRTPALAKRRTAPLLLFALVFLIAAAFVAYQILDTFPTIHKHLSKIDISIPTVSGAFILALIVLVAALGLLYSYLAVHTTRISVARGRLQTEKGIFSKHLTNLELWRVEGVELHRTLFNRLTGDGTLVLRLHSEKDAVQVTGIARGRRLHEIYQELLNLVFLLRGNPVVKGIIQ